MLGHFCEPLRNVTRAFDLLKIDHKNVNEESKYMSSTPMDRDEDPNKRINNSTQIHYVPHLTEGRQRYLPDFGFLISLSKARAESSIIAC